MQTDQPTPWLPPIIFTRLDQKMYKPEEPVTEKIKLTTPESEGYTEASRIPIIIKEEGMVNKVMIRQHHTNIQTDYISIPTIYHRYQRIQHNFPIISSTTKLDNPWDINTK